MNKYQLLARLRDLEETQLIDLLGLTSDEIVDAFLSLIEDRFEYLHNALNDPYQEEE